MYTEIYVYVMSTMAALMTTKQKRALTTENYAVDTICNNEKEAEKDKKNTQTEMKMLYSIWTLEVAAVRKISVTRMQLSCG